MSLRRENYCLLLNVTNAILGYTSKINYKRIECNYQTRDSFCNNLNELFANIHVIPNPSFVKIVNLLENSLMNGLECSNKPSKIHTLHFNSEIFIIIGIAIIIVFMARFKIKKY